MKLQGFGPEIKSSLPMSCGSLGLFVLPQERMIKVTSIEAEYTGPTKTVGDNVFIGTKLSPGPREAFVPVSTGLCWRQCESQRSLNHNNVNQFLSPL